MTTKRMKVSLVSIGFQHADSRAADSLKVLTIIAAQAEIRSPPRRYAMDTDDYDRGAAQRVRGPWNSTSATPARINTIASST